MEEARPIAAAIFILLLLLVFTASLAYLAEHKVQPETFGSIPHAMWWAVITMTTVGYGDVTPITLTGKFLASIIGIIGLGMVALPAGLLASGFTHKLHRQEKAFETVVDEVLSDGMITGAEKDRLIQAQADLDISEEEAIADLKEAIRGYIEAFGLADAFSRIFRPTIRQLEWDLEELASG